MAAGTDFAVNHTQIAQTGDSMFQGYLEPELVKDYFAEAEKTSIVQTFAQKVPMGTTGQKIPHWTGDVSAAWLGEGDMKPITKGNMTSQNIAPHKIATIFIASAEAVRANPANYLGTMRTKVATAFAMAFDAAALYGEDSPFPTFINQTSKKISIADPGGAGNSSLTVYDALAVNGLKILVDDGKKWTHTLLDDVAEPILNGAKDANERPLFIEQPYGEAASPFRAGRIVARPTILSDHVVKSVAATTSPAVAAHKIVGFAGDFSQILWGQVGGLSYDVTDQATLNLGTFEVPKFVSLWQHNLVAVRVEAEYAMHVNDPQAFIRLTDLVVA